MFKHPIKDARNSEDQIQQKINTNSSVSHRQIVFRYYCWILFFIGSISLYSCATSMVTVDVSLKHPKAGSQTDYYQSNCEKSGLEKITANVYKVSKSKVIATNTWDCAEESAKQIKVRSTFKRKMDTTIVVSGKDANGNILYLGKKTNVSVPLDETCLIDAYEFVPAVIDVEHGKMQWHPVKGAAEYRVVVASDINFNDIMTDNMVHETNFSSSTPDTGKLYFCKVYARNQNGIEGGASEIWSFVGSKTENVE